jgi:cell division septum initiation protein DivIVA
LKRIRSENFSLNQEIQELEKELNHFTQSSEANGDSWVDSVLCNMDSNQFAYLKQLHDAKHKSK